MKVPLTAREKKTMQALAECILPVGGPHVFSHSDVNYVRFTEELLLSTPVQVWWFIHFNLWFIQYFSWLYIKRPALFSRLPFTDREFILASLSKSRSYFLRGIYLLTSSLFLITMYKDERVMRAIGYFGFMQGANKQPGNP